MGYRFIGAWKQESGRLKLKSLPILPICAVWVEIPNKQPRESLPFSEFPAIWVENSKKQPRESLPILPICVVWVEIPNKQSPESLPDFADLRHLGRDSQQADPGFSTLFTHKYMQ